MRLSTRNVTTIRAPEGVPDFIAFDDEVPGFGLRIRGAGRNFLFQYRHGRQQRRMSLGKANAATLEGARKAAAQLHARVVLGEDPAAERADRRDVSLTVAGLVSQFLQWQKSRPRSDGSIGLKPRGLAEIERHLAVSARPLHPLPVVSITRSHVAALLGSITTASGPVAGNRVRASLSSAFAWAVTEGLAEVNPVIGTRRNPEAPRERVLTDDEIRILWEALPEGDYGAIVRLLLLTGQRKTEIADLRWSEVRNGGSSIELAPARTKNGRAHVVPLSMRAAAILEMIPRRADADGTLRDYVFGNGARGFVGWSKAKTALDARIAVSGNPIEPWTVHDLRRTAATKMADLGVQPHVIEQILNHVSGHKSGVAGIYNQSSYATETRRAVELWATHLGQIILGTPAMSSR